MVPIEREDIEALGSALYKIPKQIEKFADRYSLALQHLEHIDFAPRAAMLEQAASVVAEMIHELKRMDLDRMSVLNEKLRSLENEADRLMLELYRDIYSGQLDHLQMFLLKEFFEILEKRSEEHTSELQSLMRISYAVFCLKKKKYNYKTQTQKRIVQNIN